MIDMGSDRERRPGRKPLEPGKKSASVHIKFGPSLHDEAAQKALRAGMSLPELTRRAIRRYDPADDEDI